MIDLYPRYDSDFVNYVPESRIINAFVNTIDLIKNITEKYKVDDVHGFFFNDLNHPLHQNAARFEPLLPELEEKRLKIKEIFEIYLDKIDRYSRISEKHGTTLDYNIVWVNLVDEIIDLLLFFNRRFSFISDNLFNVEESDDLSTKKYIIWSQYTMEFESTEIDESLLNDETNIISKYIGNNKNVTFVRLYLTKEPNKPLFDFVQGSEPEINSVEEAIEYENIIEDICYHIKDDLVDCFNKVIYYYYHKWDKHGDCLMDDNFIRGESGHVQYREKEKRDDNEDSHKRHPLRSLFFRNSV